MESPESPPLPGRYAEDLQLRVSEGSTQEPVVAQLQDLADLLSTGLVGGG